MRGVKIAVLVAVWAGLLLSGVRAVVSVRRQLWLSRLGKEVEAGQYEAVLKETTHLEDDSKRWAALPWRCAALEATGRASTCRDELVELADRAPRRRAVDHAGLAVRLVSALRERGRMQDAASIAHEATAVHPTDIALLRLELLTRSQVENEPALCEEMEERLPEMGEASVEIRFHLAERHRRRGDTAHMLRTLGDSPPRSDRRTVATWHDLRARAYAEVADTSAVWRTYDELEHSGGDPLEVAVRRALLLSYYNLSDPARPTAVELERAYARRGEIKEPELIEALYGRVLEALVIGKQTEEALRVYDEGHARFPLAAFSREGISRAALPVGRMPGKEREGGDRGMIVLRVGSPADGDQILVSPEADRPVDDPYDVLSVPRDGLVRIDRGTSIWPYRWVYRDGTGAVRGSGTTWLAPGGTVTVDVAPRPPLRPASYGAHPRPGDGRRRVFGIILDCGDWRFVRYGVARGELPFFSEAIEEGERGVLWSDPPLTAVAMDRLMFPGDPGRTSVIRTAYEIGNELSSVDVIGRNPLAGLSIVLPEREGLFAVVGAGDLDAVNMIFMMGQEGEGRGAQITGPHGRVRQVTAWNTTRELTHGELASIPGLDQTDFQQEIRSIAAELDAARRFAEDGTGRLFILRLHAVDILTHSRYAEAATSGQDDGNRTLYLLYRYLDRRLGEIRDALDGDDVLVVLSDHGIRTAMEHDPRAIFLAVGGGAPRGRLEGTPSLVGLPSFLAGLLGVHAPWPDSGIAPWGPPTVE